MVERETFRPPWRGEWFDTQEEIRAELEQKTLSPMEFRHRFFDFLVDFKGNSLTWGATPLGDSEAIRANQTEVANTLSKGWDTDAHGVYIPKDLQQHMALNVMARFYERAADNKYSYSTRLRASDPSIDGYQLLAEYGEGTPYQNAVVGRALGMKSIEWARLTHQAGHGIWHLPDMRLAVDAALYATGAAFAEPNESFEVLQSDTASTLLASTTSSLLMKRERLLATYDDQTRVKERSTFLLRIDPESGFDQDLADKIRNTNISSPTWARRVMNVGELSRVVRPLLLEDSFTKALPIATTIYSYNPIVEGLVELSKIDRIEDPSVERIRKLAQRSLEQQSMLFVK